MSASSRYSSPRWFSSASGHDPGPGAAGARIIASAYAEAGVRDLVARARARRQAVGVGRWRA